MIKTIKRIYHKIFDSIKYGSGVSLHRVTLGENVYIAHHAEIVDSTIGAYSSVGRFDKIREADIGKYCSISWDVTIGAPTHPFRTASSCALTYRKEYGLIEKDIVFPQKRTSIGNDVWIGCDVTIISGISIGNGAVVGAGAVCTQNIPPYEIWGGVPARKIADRYQDNKLSARLNNLNWWDWSIEKQRKALKLFEKELDEEILKQLEEINSLDL